MQETEPKRKFSPLSLIMPCFDILFLMLFTSRSHGVWQNVVFIYITPPVISVMLICVKRVNIFRYLGVQFGLFITEVITLTAVFAFLWDAAVSFRFPDNIAAVLTVLLSYAAAVTNLLLYRKKTGSSPETAALVLCDPALIWAVMVSVIIIS